RIPKRARRRKGLAMRWLGRLLKNVHAGEEHLASHHAAVRDAPRTIALTSPSFAAGAPTPPRPAGKGVGGGGSPAPRWSGVPPEAVDLVIIMEDPDAPIPRPFTHFALTLPASRASLAEGEVSRGKETAGTRLGKNSVGRLDYMGPRPVPGHGPHR